MSVSFSLFYLVIFICLQTYIRWRGGSLKVLDWYWRADRDNRRYDDVPLKSARADDLWLNYWNMLYTLPSSKPDLPDEDDCFLLDACIGAENFIELEIDDDW